MKLTTILQKHKSGGLTPTQMEKELPRTFSRLIFGDIVHAPPADVDAFVAIAHNYGHVYTALQNHSVYRENKESVDLLNSTVQYECLNQEERLTIIRGAERGIYRGAEKNFFKDMVRQLVPYGSPRPRGLFKK